MTYIHCKNHTNGPTCQWPPLISSFPSSLTSGLAPLHIAAQASPPPAALVVETRHHGQLLPLHRRARSAAPALPQQAPRRRTAPPVRLLRVRPPGARSPAARRRAGCGAEARARGHRHGVAGGGRGHGSRGGGGGGRGAAAGGGARQRAGAGWGRRRGSLRRQRRVAGAEHHRNQALHREPAVQLRQRAARGHRAGLRQPGDGRGVVRSYDGKKPRVCLRDHDHGSRLRAGDQEPRRHPVRWSDDEGELRRPAETEGAAVPGDGAQALRRQPVVDGNLGDAHGGVPAVRQRRRRQGALRRRDRPLPGIRLRLLLHQGRDGPSALLAQRNGNGRQGDQGQLGPWKEVTSSDRDEVAADM